MLLNQKVNSSSFSLAFLLSIEATLTLFDQRNLHFKSYLLTYTHTFFVLTSLLVVDNTVQESDHSYSTSVSLQDVSAYSDNSCLINYITINLRLRSSIELFL